MCLIKCVFVVHSIKSDKLLCVVHSCYKISWKKIKLYTSELYKFVQICVFGTNLFCIPINFVQNLKDMNIEIILRI